MRLVVRGRGRSHYVTITDLNVTNEKLADLAVTNAKLAVNYDYTSTITTGSTHICQVVVTLSQEQ